MDEKTQGKIVSFVRIPSGSSLPQCGFDASRITERSTKRKVVYAILVVDLAGRLRDGSASNPQLIVTQDAYGYVSVIEDSADDHASLSEAVCPRHVSL
jgi:hypothetical protein